MGVFNSTGVDLALAGDVPGFNNWNDANWPDGFRETVGATVERALEGYVTTSGSSVTIGVGSKAFALDSDRSWTSGTPVYITENGDPENNYMVGKLSADVTGGIATVNVTSVSGTGTFTAWTIQVLFAVSTLLSPPLGFADGGHGASSPEGARANLEVSRWRLVDQYRASNEFFPAEIGKLYVFGPDSPDLSAHAYATWDGLAYTYEPIADGDTMHFKVGISGLPSRAAYHAADDILLELQTPAFHATFQLNSTQALPVALAPEVLYVTNAPLAVADITGTLPQSGANAKIMSFKVAHNHPFNLILNVASGGTIDGAASLTLTPGDSVRLIYWEGEWRAIA